MDLLSVLNLKSVYQSTDSEIALVLNGSEVRGRDLGSLYLKDLSINTPPFLNSSITTPTLGERTIQISLANQAINTVFAAPAISGGTPSFRLLVENDIPSLSISKITSLQASLDSKIGLSSALTGFTVGTNTAITAADTILSAFRKTQGQINALSTASGNFYQNLDVNIPRNGGDYRVFPWKGTTEALDFDLITGSGFYKNMAGSGATNGPKSGYWYVENLKYSTGDGNTTQIAWPYRVTDGLYFRTRVSGVWQPWTQVLHTSMLPNGVLIGASGALSGVVGTANQLLRRNAANTAYEFFTPSYLVSSDLANYVTTNTDQTTGLIGVKHWSGAHRWILANGTDFTATIAGIQFLKGAQTANGQPEPGAFGTGIQFTSDNNSAYRHQLVVSSNNKWYVGQNGGNWESVWTSAKPLNASAVPVNGQLLQYNGTEWVNWTPTYAPGSGSTSYIQNQYLSAQEASFWINGPFRNGGSASIGYGSPSGVALNIGYNRSGNADSSLDLFTDFSTPTLYTYRIIKSSSINGTLFHLNKGTGSFVFRNEAAADFIFQHGTTDRYRIFANGNHRFGAGSDNGWKMQIDSGSSSGNGLWVNGIIYSTNNVKGFSDRNLKSDIERIENPLRAIAKLNGYSFTIFGRKDYGLIAQEVQQVLPHAVDTYDGRLVMTYTPIHALTVEAINELASRDTDKEQRIKILERKVQELERRLASCG